MKKFLKKLREFNANLPWNRPTLADLPKEERLRIKALMLGACAGPALGGDADGDGKLHIEVIHCEDEDERENKGNNGG